MIENHITVKVSRPSSSKTGKQKDGLQEYLLFQLETKQEPRFHYLRYLLRASLRYKEKIKFRCTQH